MRVALGGELFDGGVKRVHSTKLYAYSVQLQQQLIRPSGPALTIEQSA
jgi:hypothetical protein